MALFVGAAMPEEICCDILCYREAAITTCHEVSTATAAASGHHHHSAQKDSPQIGRGESTLVQTDECESYPQIAALGETSKFKIANPTAHLLVPTFASILSEWAIQPDNIYTALTVIRLFHLSAVTLRI